jgi:hypothetical protein
LIIAGVPKAGTTSLFLALASHPDVCGSSVKETQYFRPILDGGAPGPIHDYERFFAKCTNEQYRLEATPEYFYGGSNLIDRIKSDLGDVRVVLVLREPRSRMISFYRFKKAHLHLPSDMSFDAYVEACEAVPRDQRLARNRSAYMGMEGSHYDTYLPDWLAGLGDSLRVLFFDDLIADADAVLARLVAWLNIDPAGFPERSLGRDNSTVNFRWAPLQRIALGIASRAEGLSQSHPGLYNRMRAAYYRINGAPSDERPKTETLAYLDRHFAPHNLRLAEQLRNHGLPALPDWLQAPAMHGDRQRGRL